MHSIRSIRPLFIISIVFLLQAGCQPDDGSTKTRPNEKNKKATVDVRLGGKVWKINPDLSYRATGVWTNPNPRALTQVEQARLEAIQTETQKLRTQLEALDKESNILHRLQQPEIKVRYSFGKPPHLSKGGIVDMGEFPMELENGEFQFQMEPPIQTHSE